jgi:hypothetical protein
MGPLDTMVMAGKEAPSEGLATLICPTCRSGDAVEQPPRNGAHPGDNPNRVYCCDCGRHGVAGDWHLIEQLRIYIGRAVCSMEVY